jgi:diacylglycerol kinase (ATP)
LGVADGLLDLLIIHNQNVIDLVPLFIQISNGTHIDNPSISYFQTDDVVIECFNDESVFIDIDGEKGTTLPVTVGIVPNAVKLIIPTL